MGVSPILVLENAGMIPLGNVTGLVQVCCVGCAQSVLENAGMIPLGNDRCNHAYDQLNPKKVLENAGMIPLGTD